MKVVAPPRPKEVPSPATVELWQTRAWFSTWTTPRGSQSLAYGRRYSTSWRRAGTVVSCSVAEPLGHRRPRLMGESGSPSIWTTLSSLTEGGPVTDPRTHTHGVSLRRPECPAGHGMPGSRICGAKGAMPARCVSVPVGHPGVRLLVLGLSRRVTAGLPRFLAGAPPLIGRVPEHGSGPLRSVVPGILRTAVAHGPGPTASRHGVLPHRGGVADAHRTLHAVARGNSRPSRRPEAGRYVRQPAGAAVHADGSRPVSQGGSRSGGVGVCLQRVMRGGASAGCR